MSQGFFRFCPFAAVPLDFAFSKFCDESGLLLVYPFLKYLTIGISHSAN